MLIPGLYKALSSLPKGGPHRRAPTGQWPLPHASHPEVCSLLRHLEHGHGFHIQLLQQQRLKLSPEVTEHFERVGVCVGGGGTCPLSQQRPTLPWRTPEKQARHQNGAGKKAWTGVEGWTPAPLVPLMSARPSLRVWFSDGWHCSGGQSPGQPAQQRRHRVDEKLVFFLLEKRKEEEV